MESQTRRSFLSRSSLAAACLASAAGTRSLAFDPPKSPIGKAPAFRYCLNTSTISGSKLPIREQLKIAASAGYDAVEIWIRDVDAYVAAGGTTQELRSEIEDLGLGVDSAIAFGQWIVDDPQQRKAGLEQCRRDMAMLREIGGQRIAAPPSGATKEAGLDLRAAADRYRELLELGGTLGVVPQIELWGFSSNLSKLEEVLFVAAAAEHADACILLDIYHLYKGGSDFENIGLVPGRKMFCLHMNDYPANPPRATIKDEHRVYPGDGIAPVTHVLQTLASGGFQGTLSLELFNPSYWAQPPLEVAKTGLAKMQQCVERAFPENESA